MVKSFLSKLILTGLLLSLSFSSISAQVSLKRISLKEQIDHSNLIVEGEVIAQRSFWDANHRLIYTANTIKVYKIFKGKDVSFIEILTVGGTVGLTALVDSNSLKLYEGSFGVFTLYNNDTPFSPKDIKNKNQYKAYSGAQGYYEYDLYDNKAINRFTQIKGIKNTLYNNIMSITKTNYKEVAPFDVLKLQKNNLFPPENITFTPTTITAGTKSVLTINGTGFGNTKGKVGFRNPNNGGASFLDALDTEVLTWSDTEITIEVPSHAGTGTIRITDDSAASSVSATNLTVSSSQINIPFDPGTGTETFLVQHYNDDGSGGYTWEMETGFFNDTDHPGAKAAFTRAFNSWRCETKINWNLSTTATTTNVVGVDTSDPPNGDLNADNENVIMFDHQDFQLEAGVLGTCRSWYAGRGCTPTITWWVIDLDIVFDREANWYFGADGETFDPGKVDFETVVLHELGHGHQLDHVINGNNVMHFALPANLSKTVLDANTLATANGVNSRSTTNQICGPGVPLMTEYTESCRLSIEDIELQDSISLYPNPTTQEFSIKSSTLNLDKIKIYDLSGRLISNIDISENTRTKTINLYDASKGMYFINIYLEGRLIIKKLIID